MANGRAQIRVDLPINPYITDAMTAFLSYVYTDKVMLDFGNLEAAFTLVGLVGCLRSPLIHSVINVPSRLYSCYDPQKIVDFHLNEYFQLLPIFFLYLA